MSEAPRGDQVVSSTCPTDDLTNLRPPDQFVPELLPGAKLTAIYVVPYPEGPELLVDLGAPNAELRHALEMVDALLPRPLPAALPQTCCSRSEVTLRFGEDAANYGPCELPPNIEQALALAEDAYSHAYL